MLVCRLRNRVLQHCLNSDTTRASCPQIADRLTICSTACLAWDPKEHRNSLNGDVVICNTEIAFCSIVITVTHYKRHDVSNPQLLDSLFNIMPWLIAIETLSLGMWSFQIPKSRLVALSLHWHNMTAMTFQITGRSTVFQQHVLANSKRNIHTHSLET